MGSQIIRQPNGLLGIFDTNDDDWAAVDMTPAEVVEYYRAHALEQLERRLHHIGQITEWVLGGQAEKAYYDFTMTYEEASAVADEAPDASITSITES